MSKFLDSTGLKTVLEKIYDFFQPKIITKFIRLYNSSSNTDITDTTSTMVGFGGKASIVIKNSNLDESLDDTTIKINDTSNISISGWYRDKNDFYVEPSLSHNLLSINSITSDSNVSSYNLYATNGTIFDSTSMLSSYYLPLSGGTMKISSNIISKKQDSMYNYYSYIEGDCISLYSITRKYPIVGYKYSYINSTTIQSNTINANKFNGVNINIDSTATIKNATINNLLSLPSGSSVTNNGDYHSCIASAVSSYYDIKSSGLYFLTQYGKYDTGELFIVSNPTGTTYVGGKLINNSLSTITTGSSYVRITKGTGGGPINIYKILC